MKGRITDATTGDGVPFANIGSVVRRDIGGNADEFGNWDIPFQPGEVIYATQVAYKPWSGRAVEVIALQPEPRILPPVTIRPEKKKGGWGFWLLLAALAFTASDD